MIILAYGRNQTGKSVISKLIVDYLLRNKLRTKLFFIKTPEDFKKQIKDPTLMTDKEILLYYGGVVIVFDDWDTIVDKRNWAKKDYSDFLRIATKLNAKCAHYDLKIIYNCKPSEANSVIEGNADYLITVLPKFDETLYYLVVNIRKNSSFPIFISKSELRVYTTEQDILRLEKRNPLNTSFNFDSQISRMNFNYS